MPDSYFDLKEAKKHGTCINCRCEKLVRAKCCLFNVHVAQWLWLKIDMAIFWGQVSYQSLAVWEWIEYSGMTTVSPVREILLLFTPTWSPQLTKPLDRSLVGSLVIELGECKCNITRPQIDALDWRAIWPWVYDQSRPDLNLVEGLWGDKRLCDDASPPVWCSWKCFSVALQTAQRLTCQLVASYSKWCEAIKGALMRYWAETLKTREIMKTFELSAFFALSFSKRIWKNFFF